LFANYFSPGIDNILLCKDVSENLFPELVKSIRIHGCSPILLTLAITWPQGELNGEGGFAVAAQVHGDVML